MKPYTPRHKSDSRIERRNFLKLAAAGLGTGIAMGTLGASTGFGNKSESNKYHASGKDSEMNQLVDQCTNGCIRSASDYTQSGS